MKSLERVASREFSSASDMKGTAFEASESICITVLPPLILVRRASVRWVGRAQIEMAHHLDEFAALSSFAGEGLDSNLLAESGMAAALIIMGGIDHQLRIEPEQFAEQAVIEHVGIAGRQIGAAGAADQQRIAGEDAIFRDQAHGIAGVARRVERGETQIAHREHIAIVEPQIRKRYGAFAIHHHSGAQRLAQLARGGEMIGVGVRVYHEFNAQPVTRGQR